MTFFRLSGHAGIWLHLPVQRCQTPGRKRRNTGTHAPARTLCQHPGKAGTVGPRGNTGLPRAPNRVIAQDVGTPGETTLLQAQFSLGTIQTRLEGTPRQPAHPLPYSRISCPFDLNSLCKIIPANQRIRPPALRVPGKCLAFSECHRISRLTINCKNLDPSVLMEWNETASLLHACPDSQHLQHTVQATARLSSKEEACSLAHTMDCSLCTNEPCKAITWRSPAASK